MQICRSIAVFCSRLFCCIPSRPRPVPQSPGSQQMLSIAVTHLVIQKEAHKKLEFSEGSCKTRVVLYDCSIAFSDNTSHEVQLTRHKISQLITKFHLNTDESTLQNEVEDTFFDEALVAESVLETESPDIWLRRIHRPILSSPSMPSLKRMDEFE